FHSDPRSPTAGPGNGDAREPLILSGELRRAGGHLIQLKDVGDDVRVLLAREPPRPIEGHRGADLVVQLTDRAAVPGAEEARVRPFRRGVTCAAVLLDDLL